MRKLCRLSLILITLTPLSWVMGSMSEPPEGFIGLGKGSPHLIIEMAYAGKKNFVGQRIKGYLTNKCLLTIAAAAAIKEIVADLQKRKRGLKLFDCYRPQRAVDHFVRWSKSKDIQTKSTFFPIVKKSHLFDQGYIASKSGHSRGSTVDLTLVNESGIEIDMGTAFDFFDKTSHTNSPNVSKHAQKNRAALKQVMEKHGFRNYSKEWWHYTLVKEPFKERYFDFPIR